MTPLNRLHSKRARLHQSTARSRRSAWWMSPPKRGKWSQAVLRRCQNAVARNPHFKWPSQRKALDSRPRQSRSIRPLKPRQALRNRRLPHLELPSSSRSLFRSKAPGRRHPPRLNHPSGLKPPPFSDNSPRKLLVAAHFRSLPLRFMFHLRLLRRRPQRHLRQRLRTNSPIRFPSASLNCARFSVSTAK